MRLTPCTNANIWSLWRARSHDFAKFPVKFPVSRENGRSREPSALLRQPASPISAVPLADYARKRKNTGTFACPAVSGLPEFEPKFRIPAESLPRFLRKFPFCGETSRRLSSIALRERLSVISNRYASSRQVSDRTAIEPIFSHFTSQHYRSSIFSQGFSRTQLHHRLSRPHRRGFNRQAAGAPH